MWGTHLNLIQNPQIRAKHGGKEHINVSLGLAGVTSLKGVGLPEDSERPPPRTLMTHFV